MHSVEVKWGEDARTTAGQETGLHLRRPLRNQTINAVGGVATSGCYWYIDDRYRGALRRCGERAKPSRRAEAHGFFDLDRHDRSRALSRHALLGLSFDDEMDEYVTDVLMRDLVGHDKRPVSFLVYLWLAAEGQRLGGEVQISYQELAESIGCRRARATAVGWLVRGGCLRDEGNCDGGICYEVVIPWRARGVRD